VHAAVNHFASPDFWACYRRLPAEVRDLADKSGSPPHLLTPESVTLPVVVPLGPRHSHTGTRQGRQERQENTNFLAFLAALASWRG
jgi:hypothetical protein